MPYSLNGAILAATGGPTVNEGQLKWFQTHGAPGVLNYNDAERKFLLVATAEPANSPKTNSDLWRQFLIAGGFWTLPGDMNDAMRSYWIANATQPPAVNFTGTPVSVPSGGSVTLDWQVEGAVTITASATPANAQWTGAKAANGSLVITNITVETIFTLTATNPSGTVVENVDTKLAVSANFNIFVGGNGTSAGFERLVYGSMSPAGIFGGTCELVVGINDGQVVVRNNGAVPFPDIGTASMLLTCAGAVGSPYTLAWSAGSGSYFVVSQPGFFNFLNASQGATRPMTLTKI